MNKMRNAVLFVAVLAVTGCGCTDDDILQFVEPQVVTPTVVVGTKVDPVRVERPPQAIPVDILFLIDDSTSFSPGAISNDGAAKAAVSETVARDTAQKLAADLAAGIPGKTFDLAFGVARYEDYGGPFRDAALDPQDQEENASSKPFILQQPILRKGHGDFGTKFESALLSSPLIGDGGNVPQYPGGDFGPDPATAIEALWQAVTGGGFDGDGNGNTTGGALTGDVPQPSFTPNGNDVGGQPQFTSSVDGRPASGSIGGAGWRPNSLRYVIVFSDFATVTPLANDGVTFVSGLNGETVPARAFASFEPGDPRFGTAPTVGPNGSATLQATIDALIAADVEVLSVGIQTSAGRGGKPNQPGVVTVLPQGPVEAVTDPALPDPGPFTWMSAVALLTGATELPAEVPGPEPKPTLPLVYNLLTLSPTPAIGDPRTVTDDLREDLVDRIGVGAANITPGPAPALTPITVELTLQDPATPTSSYALTIQATQPVATPGRTVSVQVPRYYVGDPTPASVQVRWLIQAALLDPNAADVADVVEVLDVRIVPSVAVAGFTPPVGKIRLLTEGPPTSPGTPATATIDLVTAGCLYFEPVAPDTVGSSAGERCAPFPVP